MTHPAVRRSFRSLPQFALHVLIALLCLVLLAEPADAAKKKSRGKSKRRYTKVSQEKPVGLRVDVQAVADSTLRQAQTPAAKVDAMLRLGSFVETDSAYAALMRQDPAVAWRARAQDALRGYRFAEARAALDSLERYPATPEAQWLGYRWLLVREDLRTLDSLSEMRLIRDPENVPAEIARGEMFYRLLQYDRARGYFERAFKDAESDVWRAQAVLGLAKVLHREDRYQQAFDTLKTLLRPATLNDDVLFNMGLALIALSRVGEAVDMFDEATRWNPHSELAHYYLGNGFTRLDYTQLKKKYQASLAEGAALTELNQAADALRRGEPDRAREIATRLAQSHPKLVEPLVLLGSIAWNEADYSHAADQFRAALRIVPEYGRARNGLAKSLEGLRMAQNVHRVQDSLRFARKDFPALPRIDQYVINWHSLAPRHQKQVALAIEPWRLYLPVLVESGSRHYIKPLHEKLSECPGLETIRDQRVDYDSRLWDDVRGCGGFTTVTGIEDVERSIYANYNTVLHELTHQVHGVFPPMDAQRIQEVYHAAQARADSGIATFMSRYQQASVWEYFAEGANAYYTPRRDEYDTREVVRERLFERDTALVALVEHYVLAPNLEACYAVGLVNAAEDALERQDVNGALGYATRAYARDPQSEDALSELAHIYSLMDRDSLALGYADTLVMQHPRRAATHTRRATVREFTDGNMAAAAELLRQALDAVEPSERKDLRTALGRILWYLGQYDAAVEQYRAVLAEVADHPDALWGLGLALGDGGRIAGADSAFKAAIALRSGIVELRLDYARVLLQAGRLDEASVQIEEAQLLAPGDPQVVTMKGWLIAERGDYKRALSLLDRAVEEAPDQRLASVVRVKVLHKYAPPPKKRVRKYNAPSKEAALLTEAQAKDVPTWVFLPRKSAWVPAKTWPHFQRELLRQVAGAQ